MNQINPQEAPEGYYAAPTESACRGCAFAQYRCPEIDCRRQFRKDRVSVIFKKLEAKDGNSHICAFHRILDGSCVVCGSVDEAIKAANASPPHESQEACGSTTHYAGCACHERGWENKWKAAVEMAAQAHADLELARESIREMIELNETTGDPDPQVTNRARSILPENQTPTNQSPNE